MEQQPFHTFFAQAEIAQPTEDGKRHLTGVAYSGGIITDHWCFDRVIFDLSTTSIETPLPLLCNHDHDCVVGVINYAKVDTDIRIESTLFAEIDEEARLIASKADAGMPWQLSVGIWPGEETEIAAGQTVTVNGQQFTGPLTILRNNRIREVSVVALGADSQTNASVFNLPPEGRTMTGTADNQPDNTAVLTEQITQLTQENAELKAKIAEFSVKQRQSQVLSLFNALGRDHSDEAAAPYMALDDLQFAAISADLIANKPKPAASHLFSHQAVTGVAERDDQAILLAATQSILNQFNGVK